MAPTTTSPTAAIDAATQEVREACAAHDAATLAHVEASRAASGVLRGASLDRVEQAAAEVRRTEREYHAALERLAQAERIGRCDCC